MDTSKTTIVIVDDDLALLELLSDYLRGEGFMVEAYDRASGALDRLKQPPPVSVVVLDIMMPEMSGLDLLKLIRDHSHIPVIMLTGKGDDIDRIVGLELGADDYLGKPCNPRELVARIKAVLRRTQAGYIETKPDLLKVGQLSLDQRRLKAHVGETEVPLTSTEFRTLMLLATHLGELISRESLTESVLNRKLGPHDRSADVHISRIRNKLSQYPDVNLSIRSVRGIGYQLSLDEVD